MDGAGAIWSSVVARVTLTPEDDLAFQQEIRRRSYHISLFVLLIGAVAGTALTWLSYTGHGSGSMSSQEIPVRLALAWFAPVCLLISRPWSERWYPWVISLTVMASLSQFLFQWASQVPEPAAVQEQLSQLQMRTVVVTFFITTLLQLPFRFASALAIANYLVFAVIQASTHRPDTPYVLLRIGLIVVLGTLISLIIELRERRLF